VNLCNKMWVLLILFLKHPTPALIPKTILYPRGATAGCYVMKAHST